MKSASIDVEDVLFLLRTGESPESIARRAGVKPGSIGRLLHRHGYTVEARPFWSLAERLRRAA